MKQQVAWFGLFQVEPKILDPVWCGAYVWCLALASSKREFLDSVRDAVGGQGVGYDVVGAAQNVGHCRTGRAYGDVIEGLREEAMATGDVAIGEHFRFPHDDGERICGHSLPPSRGDR